jgi:hypothetical protein
VKKFYIMCELSFTVAREATEATGVVVKAF